MSKDIDLPSLLKYLNYSSNISQSALDNYERIALHDEVDIIDSSSKFIESTPNKITGFIDGIQNIKILGFNDLRPYALSYAAAGCTDSLANLMFFTERLSLKCTELDREWAENLPGNIPVRTVDYDSIWNIGPKLSDDLASDRVKLEHKISTKALNSSPDGFLVVDGSLVGHKYSDKFIGVIKTMHQQYIQDESFLESLQENYRSMVFKIPAGFKNSAYDRYSCYLKLFPLNNAHISYGLVRIEVYSLDTLDEACAAVLADRQTVLSTDQRYDRHLSGVSVCETVLKSKKPSFFSL